MIFWAVAHDLCMIWPFLFHFHKWVPVCLGMLTAMKLLVFMVLKKICI